MMCLTTVRALFPDLIAADVPLPLTQIQISASTWIMINFIVQRLLFGGTLPLSL